MRRRHLFTALVALIGGTALLAGCGFGTVQDAATPAGSAPAPESGTAQNLRGELSVFAAASLTEGFTTLGTKFEEANPEATITFNFGPSSGLATQITEGAPADVFASASVSTMDAVVAAGGATDPVPFATNVMQIAVPPDNPAAIAALADLATPGIKVALCQPDVPCGSVAAKVFASAGITVTPITLEADVKAVLTKVELGEVDAGVVYVTDVLAAGDKVTGIEIPAEVNAWTSYPISTLTESSSPELAQAFVDFVLSAEGAQVLTAAGFQQP